MTVTRDFAGTTNVIASDDGAVLLVAQRDRAGHERRWQRDARGQVLTATDVNVRQLHYRYDPQGRLVALVCGEVEAADGSGMPDAARYHFTYDAGDRLSREVRPDGIERHLHYGAAGEVLTLATVGAARARAPYLPGPRDPLRPPHDPHAERPVRLQRFERDAMLRLLATTTDTATTRYTWDAGDRLREARREPTPAGAALGVTPSSVAFEYDAAGRLTGEHTAEHGRHGAVGYTLDELDNLVSLALPHGQRIDWLHYGSGHVHQIRAGTQVISDFERDDLHREVLRTQGRFSERRGYDVLGRRTWQSVGPVGTEPLPELAGPGPQAPHAPHPPHAPPPARPVQPPPLGPGRGQFWRTYHYSAEGELAEQHDSLRGTLRYRYDPAGYLLQRAPLAPPGVAPTALAASALRPTAEQFAWDAAGNLLDAIARDSRSGPSDPRSSDSRRSAGRVDGNRLLMWQDIRFEYDPWGNLQTKRKGSAQTQHFVFDAEDRLLAVRTTSNRGTIESRFEYDALGRRIAKTDTHTEVAGGKHTEHRRFVWQGLRMVQEIRATGLSSYVYSPEARYTPVARLDTLHDEALIARNAAAGGPPPRVRVSHFHTDLVGTPLELTDEQGGLDWAGDYSAWGQADGSVGQSAQGRLEQPLRMPGQYADATTGLHYNTFRYYDPDVGRFICQDPIGLAGGENLYSYGPNPIGWADPWGWAADRLPRTGGSWDGQPGNSNWYSTNSAVNEITGGKPIAFTNNRPNFSPWSKGSLKFPEGTLNGTDANFKLVYEKIGSQKGISPTAAKSLLSQQGLTPHHLDTRTVQLVPSKLHGQVPHTGSAADMRKKSC